MSNQHTHTLTAPAGFRVASGVCGIKASGTPDLMLIVADAPCAAAGVFTRNRCPGEPVKVSKAHVRHGVARGIVCNSGVSNVATGQKGRRNALRMCEQLAQRIGCARREVLVCSTGVIGQPLPIDKIVAGIDALYPTLAHGPAADLAAARAIMTTDTRPKYACVQGKGFTLGGIAKGAGMIAPNMATMLSFLTTDANLPPELLRTALRQVVGDTYNRLSIDSDTSTSDSVLLLASRRGSRVGIKAFTQALHALCEELCLQLMRDGEGVTRLLHLYVRGCRSVKQADAIGRTVVNSPLVKTALHGGDPNWGRLIAAVGRSGVPFNPAQLSIQIGDVLIFQAGEPTAAAGRKDPRVAAAMKQTDVSITLDLGMGKVAARWLGCDLSRDYVAINADYTT